MLRPHNIGEAQDPPCAESCMTLSWMSGRKVFWLVTYKLKQVATHKGAGKRCPHQTISVVFRGGGVARRLLRSRQAKRRRGICHRKRRVISYGVPSVFNQEEWVWSESVIMLIYFWLKVSLREKATSYFGQETKLRTDQTKKSCSDPLVSALARRYSKIRNWIIKDI